LTDIDEAFFMTSLIEGTKDRSVISKEIVDTLSDMICLALWSIVIGVLTFLATILSVESLWFKFFIAVLTIFLHG